MIYQMRVDPRHSVSPKLARKGVLRELNSAGNQSRPLADHATIFPYPLLETTEPLTEEQIHDLFNRRYVILTKLDEAA